MGEPCACHILSSMSSIGPLCVKAGQAAVQARLPRVWWRSVCLSSAEDGCACRATVVPVVPVKPVAVNYVRGGGISRQQRPSDYQSV
jgi:hypothetical protein